MTEYEFHDFLTNAQMASGQATMDVVAVFCAFVVSTYVVGSRLNRTQAIALSIVYTIFLLLPTMTVRSTLLRIQQVAELNPNHMIPMGSVETIGVVAAVMPGILVLAWLLSIFYLISERRKLAG